MTVERIHLTELVPYAQRKRVHSHATESRRAEVLALQILTETFREQLPWGPLVLEYWLSANPGTSTETKAENLRVVTRGFRCLWTAQNKPATLTAVDFSSCTDDERQKFTTVAKVVEKALQEGQADKLLLPEVHHLLPEHYIGVLGWTNLDTHLPPFLLALLDAQSGANSGAVPMRYQALAVQLWGYRRQPFFTHLAFAVAALMGARRDGKEQNQPISIADLLRGACMALQASFLSHGLTCMSEYDPDVHLMAYIHSDVTSPSEGTRAAYAAKYLHCVEAQMRWCESHPQMAETVQEWQLKDVTEAHAEQIGLLVKRTRKAAKRGRQAQVKAVEPYLLTILSAALTREDVFSELHTVYLNELEAFRNQPEPQPRPFHFRLRDGSATLLWTIWTPNLLSDADQMMVQRVDRKRRMRNQVVVEFRGAVDDQGKALPMPFFAERIRGWYDVSARTSALRSGTPAYDFEHGVPGLLRPASALGAYIHRHAARMISSGRTPRVLLDLTALSAGLTYGLFVLLYGLITGMRLHELQQLNVDAEFSNYEKDGKGKMICRVRPKGEKGPDGTETGHIIDAEMVEYWRKVERAYRHQWGEYYKWVVPERGDEYDLDYGLYLLQAGGKALTQQQLATLLRFITFGIPLATPDSQRFDFIAHFLRYMYGRLRHALGHAEKDIQTGYGHMSIKQAREYFRGLVEARATGTTADKSILRALEQRSFWDELCFTYGEDPQ